MNLQRLKKILEAPGAPGHEKPVREYLYEQFQNDADLCRVDKMGNLIVHRKGDGPRVMYTAHMDEIALIVTKVDSNGFIRFSTLGGFDPENLISQQVTVHGKEDLTGVIGKKPVHVQTDEEKKKKTDIKSLFVDTGLNADKVRSIVYEGAVITRSKQLIELGNSLAATSMDNRISCYILTEAMLSGVQSSADIYAVFTTQEEVGIRGARVAAQAIQPEIGINLDVTIANDLPGVKEQDYCTELGKGTAVKVMDRSIVCTPSLVNYLVNLAEENEIPCQREVLTAGGTDTSAMQYLMGIGSHVTSISIPTRYIHSTIEMCSKDDIKASIDLTIRSMEEIENYRFE